MSGTKTVCQLCGDGWGDEEFMLGMCCGQPLIEVPKTEADLEKDRRYAEAKKRVLAAAAKLDW